MERNDKYYLRENKIPYYYEYDLERKPVSLKMFEIFDGNEVKWGIREDYITIHDYKYCRMTPLFQNMTDEELGNDKERFIYLGDNKVIIHAKLNNSEVLCKLNNEDTSFEKPILDIEDFGGDNVEIQELHEAALVKYHEDDIPKCVYFDYKNFAPCSNEFNIIYNENFFIKSYIINGKVRMFLGKLSYPIGVVRSLAYDINKGEFINFPLTSDELIDEEKMMEYFKKDKPNMGFSPNIFKDLNKVNLFWALTDLNVYAYGIITRFRKYVEYEDRAKRPHKSL